MYIYVKYNYEVLGCLYIYGADSFYTSPNAHKKDLIVKYFRYKSHLFAINEKITIKND